MPRKLITSKDAPKPIGPYSQAVISGEYRVIEAEDAHSAIALISSASTPTDLVLTDIVLQGMSGRELAVRLSIEHPGVKLLLMSGYSADTMQLKEGEVAKFLHKPISVEALALRIAGALRDRT